MPLPITAGLIRGESLQGCLLRHAELNTYDSLHWIGGLVGADTSRVTGLASLARRSGELAEILDVPSTELAAAGYVGRDTSGHAVEAFGGQVFSRLLLDMGHVGICPQCLRESRHIRQVWDIALVVACPHHARLLLRSCPQCGKGFKWGRSSVSFCDCGFDLASAETPAVSEATKHLMEILYVAVGEPSVTKNFGFPSLPLLGMFSLQALTHLILYIATWLRFGRTVTFRHLVTMRVPDRIGLCVDVAQVFDSWPEGWRKLIQDFVDKKIEKNGNQLGLQTIFGELYNRLFDKKATSYLGFLRRGFSEFVSNGEICRLLSCRGNPSGFHREKSEQKYVTAAGAMQILRIGQGTFNWLVRVGQLKVATQQVGNLVIYRIERESVAAARRYLDELVSTREMAIRLGVTIGVCERLAQTGVLEAVRGRTVDGYRIWKFEAAASARLMCNFDRIAKACEPEEGVRLVPLGVALKALRTFGIEASDLFQEVLASKLPISKTVASITRLDDVLIKHGDMLKFGRSVTPSGSVRSEMLAA